MRGRQRRPMQAFGAGHVEVGFINGSHLDQWRERGEYVMDFLGIFQVAMAMAVNENGVWTKLGRGAQRHSRMYAKLAGFVGGRGNDSAVVTLASNDHCFAFERGVEQL